MLASHSQFQAGFSKGLLWLTGVDRCQAVEAQEQIAEQDLHVATTKGRILKIQLLHEVIVDIH